MAFDYKKYSHLQVFTTHDERRMLEKIADHRLQSCSSAIRSMIRQEYEDLLKRGKIKPIVSEGKEKEDDI